MTTAQIWNNIIAYALQIGLLVGLGALTPPLLKLRTPRARLLFWQTLLVACLLLPWIHPWRQEVINVSAINTITTAEAPTLSTNERALSTNEPAQPTNEPTQPTNEPTPTSRDRQGAVIHRPIPFTTIVLYLLAAGIAVRLAWLIIGLARLAGYRRRGHEMASDPVFKIATAVSVRWLVSEEIPSPVTFGWRDPVVLLPARFPSLRPELREAILCHEMIHVERRDWMFTVAEELVRAVLWFHPAIWWVLGELQLAREQTVDQAVIEITHAREPYVDALLAMAGAPAETPAELDLAPASLFLRRRHLKQRVIGLLQEVRMSPFSGTRLVLAQTGAMAIIVGACWLASGAFPLSAAPQLVADAAGVVVNTGDAKLLHRAPVAYPPEALEKGIQGHVVVQASVDADGELSEKTIVSCLRELCDAAVDSLPNWQFDAHQANTTHAISIDFVRPRTAAPQLLAQAIRPAAPGLMPSTLAAPAHLVFNALTTWVDGAYVSVQPATTANALGHTLHDIRIAGLSDTASSQLRSRLPLHEGDTWSAATANLVSQIVAGFDRNLEIDVIHYMSPQQWELWIGPAISSSSNAVNALPPPPPGVYTPAPGDDVKTPTVIAKVDPAYTDEAKTAGIQGTVTLAAVIGADGSAQNIQVVGSLDPGLDQSAAEALAKWRFKPGTKDGAPVSIQAQVNLTFRML
jgi:TonB family protein